jgi:hypothetical protein
MTKEVGSPAWPERSRRIRTQVEWNVEMSGGPIPAGRTSASTRCRISAAALFVNVTAMTERGFTPSNAQEVRDAVGDDPRLAAARSREDEHRPLGRGHGIALGGVSGDGAGFRR